MDLATAPQPATVEDPSVNVAPSIAVAASEPRWTRWLFAFIAIAAAVGYWFFLSSFSAAGPGRTGIDENAYLVAGRLIAEHGTTGFKPSDDYQFVGAMWVRTPDGWYYPKYPFGTALLYAITVLFHHREWAFAISPACTALGVLGLFFLARDILASSFYALLAMIVLATGPVTLDYSDLPNSHAPSLCAVAWGMFFLLRWWRSGRWALGAAAGLLLGFAVTIRYTEALLLFPLYSLEVVSTGHVIGPDLVPILKVLGFLPVGPLGVAALSRVRWRSWRSYVSAAIPIIAWAVPVGTLVTYNWFAMGYFSGYDATHESSGFSLDELLRKWDFTVYQLYVFGLFLFAPLGIAGLVLMYRRTTDRANDRRATRRAAVFLTLWFVPGTLLYTAYYWGDNQPGLAYLRFFLTLMPPLLIAAMYVLKSADVRSRGRAIAAPLAAGILVAASASIGLSGVLGDLDREHRGNMNLHYSAREVLAHVKPSRAGKPMIIADGGIFPQFIQYMQFMLDADWYAGDIFAPRTGGGFGLAAFFQPKNASDPQAPVLLQQERIDYIDSVRRNKTDADYVRDEHQLMDHALSAGRHVYAVMSLPESNVFRSRFITGSPYEMVELTRWTEPCAVTFPPPTERHWLALPVWPDSMILPWHPQQRAMFEIRQTATLGRTEGR